MGKRNTIDLKMESRIKTVNQQDQNFLRIIKYDGFVKSRISPPLVGGDKGEGA